MLLIISGSSGVGKNTIIEELKRRYPNYKHFASYTTRGKREGEVEGGNYYYVTRDEFMDRVNSGDICEYEESHGNLYGCSLDAIRKNHSDDVVLTKDLGVEGAVSVKRILKDEIPVFTVFLTVDKDELRRRLEGRGEKQIDLRLARYDYEQKFTPFYDMVISNDDMDKTINAIVSGVNKEKESNKQNERKNTDNLGPTLYK